MEKYNISTKNHHPYPTRSFTTYFSVGYCNIYTSTFQRDLSFHYIWSLSNDSSLFQIAHFSLLSAVVLQLGSVILSSQLPAC